MGPRGSRKREGSEERTFLGAPIAGGRKNAESKLNHPGQAHRDAVPSKGKMASFPRIGSTNQKKNSQRIRELCLDVVRQALETREHQGNTLEGVRDRRRRHWGTKEGLRSRSLSIGGGGRRTGEQSGFRGAWVPSVGDKVKGSRNTV